VVTYKSRFLRSASQQVGWTLKSKQCKLQEWNSLIYLSILANNARSNFKIAFKQLRAS